MTTAPSTTSPAAASLSAPVVAVQSLSKLFRDFWMRDRARAVDGLTFDIRPREVFGLLGPNGSGKSTTIKLILGLLKPSSGRVAVFGKLPTDVAIKKRIGYLPEESYLYPFLNARETLDYYAKLFGLDHDTRRRRIDELLDMIGLTGAQHRPVREYSKGMQRRIGIAQALINDPDLLILDEPTTGLDPLGNRQVKDLILDLGRRGKTILLSSHLLSDVEDVVDRMVILYGGKVQAEGTCESLLESQNRTTIEADALDEDTIAEIDRVIRVRSGGLRTISRVSKPRQKLEDLFLDIVERARSEQRSTSGAVSGGQTAAFLKPREGEALIDQLVRGAPEPQTPSTSRPPRDMNASQAESASDEPTLDSSVIDSLMAGKDAAPGTAGGSGVTSAAPQGSSALPQETPPARPAPEVDLSLIESLTDDARKPDAPREERRA